MATIISLEVKTTGGQAGAASDTLNLEPWKTIQFTGVSVGTFSYGSYQVQGSNDRTNWENIGSAVTLNGLVTMTETIAFLRVYTNSHTSGTPVATLAALRPV